VIPRSRPDFVEYLRQTFPAFLRSTDEYYLSPRGVRRPIPWLTQVKAVRGVTAQTQERANYRFDAYSVVSLALRQVQLFSGIGMNRKLMLALSTAAALCCGRPSAAQTATIDQQQAVINTQAQLVLAIGAQGQQRLAQVVTAGRTGTLKEIALAIACAPQHQLILEIQAVGAGKPNGTVLGSYAFDNVGPYVNPPVFKTLDLQNPLHFNAGDQFAIVLSSTPPDPNFFCSTYPGPTGNPYAGGNAFVNSITDPSGQWTLITEGLGTNPAYGADLPFQTFVAPDAASLSTEVIPTLQPLALAFLVLLLVVAASNSMRWRHDRRR
jgi:hypothetical protein